MAEEEEDCDDCVICIEALSRDGPEIASLSCRHRFHLDCVSEFPPVASHCEHASHCHWRGLGVPRSRAGRT